MFLPIHFFQIAAKPHRSSFLRSKKKPLNSGNYAEIERLFDCITSRNMPVIHRPYVRFRNCFAFSENILR